MSVPFQTPAVPFDTSISLVNINPHSSDSYHPRDSGDHSNRCTRIAEGSIPLTVALRNAARDVAESSDSGI